MCVCMCMKVCIYVCACGEDQRWTSALLFNSSPSYIFRQSLSLNLGLVDRARLATKLQGLAYYRCVLVCTAFSWVLRCKIGSSSLHRKSYPESSPNCPFLASCSTDFDHPSGLQLLSANEISPYKDTPMI